MIIFVLGRIVDNCVSLLFAITSGINMVVLIVRVFMIKTSKLKLLKSCRIKIFGEEDDHVEDQTFESFDFSSANADHAENATKLAAIKTESKSHIDNKKFDQDFLNFLHEDQSLAQEAKSRPKRELTRWTGRSIYTPERCRRRCHNKIDSSLVTSECRVPQ